MLIGDILTELKLNMEVLEAPSRAVVVDLGAIIQKEDSMYSRNRYACCLIIYI